MKNPLIIIGFLIYSFLGYSQRGNEQKVKFIIEKLQMVETQKFMLFDLKIEKIKSYASGVDSLRLLEIETQLSDSEIIKKVGYALNEYYTNKEIKDLHKFVKTSAFDKLITSDKLRNSIDDQFKEINEELDLIASKRPKNKKSTRRIVEPMRVDREDGFYATVGYNPGNPKEYKLTESPALTFKHILNVTKKIYDSEYDLPEILIELTEEGQELFAQMTSENIQKPIAIVVDKQIISAPIVIQTISEGKVSISGEFSDEKLDTIIEKLKNK